MTAWPSHKKASKPPNQTNGKAETAKPGSQGKAQTSSQIIDKVGKGEKDETVYVIAGSDGSPEKIIVSEWLKKQGDVKIVAYKRFTLVAE